ncbi:MAG: hypothetical protein AAB571_12185 [Chloroflexota bacterium]
MKKKLLTNILEDDMRPEYDFSNGVRGKYAKELRENGYTIRVYQKDGTFTEKRVAGTNTVTLAPDVLAYFPDSKAVNTALRTLISLVPHQPKIVLKKEQAKRNGHRMSAK